MCASRWLVGHYRLQKVMGLFCNFLVPTAVMFPPFGLLDWKLRHPRWDDGTLTSGGPEGDSVWDFSPEGGDSVTTRTVSIYLRVCSASHPRRKSSWREHISPKRRCLPASSHGDTTQKNNFTAVTTSDFTWYSILNFEIPYGISKLERRLLFFVVPDFVCLKRNGLWVVPIKQYVNFKPQLPAMLIFFGFSQK
jgi:hypothetical protein